MRAKTIEHTTSLIAQNAEFKAQLQEKGFAIAVIKNELIKLQGNSVDTKFSKSSILRKPFLQSVRNQSVVRQPTAFKSERPRISKPQFASQVDVNNDLPKPVTTHYLPKERESAFAKPYHMTASSESRNSSKNMPRFSSNDMIHNHYLEEAKKKIQERGTSINVQEERNLYLSAGTPFNLKKETIKAWIKENVISERPRHTFGIKNHESSSIKDKDFRNSDIKDLQSQTKKWFSGEIVSLRSILWEIVNLDEEEEFTSFQDDAKYEHVGQDPRSQDGKDNKDKQGKDLKISEQKTKSKDNDKGSRSKITKREGTSLQYDKDQRFKNSTTKQSQQAQGSKI
ncbi:hypothetical protein Tco_0609164 [Tanacetum coccineum]